MKADVKTLIGKILNTPVVVETGTSGIWTYRKWSDGTAECWGTNTVNLNINNSYGGICFGNLGTINLPAGLFLEAPTMNISTNLRGGVGGATAREITNTSFALYLWNGVAYNATNISYHTHAIGKWK